MAKSFRIIALIISTIQTFFTFDFVFFHFCTSNKNISKLYVEKLAMSSNFAMFFT